MATTITERLNGAPTLAGSATDLAALEDFNGTGIPERTGTNAWSLRSVSGADDAWSPENAGGLSLGTAVLPWSDLFLALGGVINWSNGDVTLTHAANTLTFSGASSGYVFDAPLLPASGDGAALGSASASFSDLFLASGGVIAFASGDVTITHAANALAFAGASSGYAFDVAPNVGGSTVALLGTENQTLSGGAVVAPKDLGIKSSGTLTVDCGARPEQYCVNGGAFSLDLSAAVNSCWLQITNNGSAGAITTSAFDVVAGDSFDTTDTNVFHCLLRYAQNGQKLLHVVAGQ